MDAKTANIIFTDQANSVTNFVISYAIPDEELRRYTEHYWKEDLWRIGAERTGLPANRVTRGEELVDDQTFFESDFYQDHLRNFDIFHRLGVLLEPTPTQRFLVSVQRPHSAGAFTDELVDRLDALKPHLTRTAQILRRLAHLERSEKMLVDALDNSSFGMVFLLSDGTVARANGIAQQIFDEDDGLSVKDGRLATLREREGGQLDALQRRAVDGHYGGTESREMFIERPSGRRPLNVLALPLDSQEFWLIEHHPVALLVIGDPERGPGSPRTALQAAYALTDRETTLAMCLLSGDNVRQAATIMGTTENTARS